MALVDMTVVEQRYRAVLAVQAGRPVTEVAAKAGVSRQTLHTWLARYRDGGLGGLVDRSHRPASCPHRADAAVETAVCELRRHHPRWGPRRIRHELGVNGCPGPVPSRMTVHRILVRHGLIDPTTRKRRRQDYRRWQRDAPMQLWQLDIVGGLLLESGAECKIVTGVDDHSRYCVIAAVVPRATGRAVCLAFAAALARFGIPDEVLTDNGKQFTDRFGAGGEVLFDRICRDNGIIHRLTQPASPTTTGKVERFHQTLRRELLNDHGPFTDLPDAQAELDRWLTEYNTDRPHQSLDMDTPASRFATDRSSEQLLPLRLPAALRTIPAAPQPTTPAPQPPSSPIEPAEPAEPVGGLPPAYSSGPVEFERVVPPSGNLAVAGKQFWLGTARAGVTVTFWADCDVIHLLVAGARVKTVRSHLSVNDLAALAAHGGRPAGPPPLPPAEPGAAIEVDRIVNKTGIVSLAGRQILAADILGGRLVSIRIDQTTLAFFDPATRQLLRARPNPLSWDQVSRLRGARQAGPPPRPATEPVTVQRRASATGVILVARQKIALGRAQAGQTVTVHVAEHTLTIETDGGPRTITRTTTRPIRNLKANRPWSRKTSNVS
ncbi:MAG TPA: IS481 family transposase [Mycobacteriales bacterium]